jgi:hypothetical protein
MSAGYKVGPEVLNSLPSLRYLFDPAAAPVRPATPEEQALYARRCAEGGDLHDLVVLAEAPADLPGPDRREDLCGLDPIAGTGADRVEPRGSRAMQPHASEDRAGEPQTPDREVEDEGRDGGADV